MHPCDFAVQMYIPSLLTLGLATWRALTNGVGADMTWVEGLNIPVCLSLTLCSPAAHQRKTLPQVAATSSAWVPDWETFGADLNPASRKVAPADGQTHKWGRSMLVVSEWNFGHICYTSLEQQAHSLKTWVIQENTKVNQIYKPCPQGAADELGKENKYIQ